MRTRNIAALMLAVAWLFSCSSCAVHPSDRAKQSINGFSPGQSYLSNQQVALARRGDILMLVGRRNEDPETIVIGQLPPGTEVSIRRIVSFDSITHGTISYPQGEIRSGRWSGQVVALAQEGLRPKFRPSHE